MCFFFHNWGKWSTAVSREYVRVVSLHGVEINSRQITKMEQHRECLKCGKYQIRTMEE